MSARPAWLALVALPLAAGAAAQTATQIDPDMDPARSLGTSVSSAGTTHVIDGGTRAGANLFHSFARFDLGQGQTARWVHSAGNPGGIANVINRVTGGMPSFIDGTIDSTALPNADFWFVNPSGILFGAGARLDVPAAAHFSTAHALRFDDGTAFAVTTPSGSTFSFAAPAAFGFDGGQGDISVDGVGADFLPATGQLTLAGRDVAVFDSTIAGSGLQLFGVGAIPAAVPLGDPLTASLSGTVTIGRSQVTTVASSAASGELTLAGGTILISDRSEVGTEAEGGALVGTAMARLEADLVRIDGGSTLYASTRNARPGADIEIDAGELVLTAGGWIRSASLSPCFEGDCGPGGPAGGIHVRADSVHMWASRVRDRPDPPTGLSSNTLGRGNAGSVTIEADLIVMDGPTFISSDSVSSGRSGVLKLEAREIRMEGGALISSQTFGLGDGGEIDIDADSLVVGLESLIESGSGSPRGFRGAPGGKGGRISIRVDDLLVTNTGQIRTSSFSEGDAGTVEIDADRMTIERFGSLASDSFAGGDGGGITIGAGELRLVSGGRITSDALGDCIMEGCSPPGSAGNIKVTADAVTIEGTGFEQSGLSTSTMGGGNAGTIDIEADSIRLRGDTELQGANDSAVVSSRSEGAGDAGRIIIRADELSLRNGAELDTASSGTGDAGAITVSADRIHLDEFSLIGSNSAGEGNGGSIDLTAGELLITEGAKVLAQARGCEIECARAGNGGSITVRADTLTLAGTDDEFGGQPAEISSSTFTTGTAGDVSVIAEQISMDRGNIASETFGAGPAGTVTVTTGSLSLTNVSQVSTSSRGGCEDGCPDANAGSVIIRARGAIDLQAASQITSVTRGAADAGSVDIVARSLSIDNDSQVSSGSELGASGGSGTVLVDAAEVALRGGVIGTVSVNTNPAGNIHLRAGTLLVEGIGATVTSENISGMFGASEGDAGSVSIQASQLTLREGGSLSTSSDLGAAGDIVVAMPEGSILRLEGEAAPGTITTSSGPGTGGRIIIANPYAIISNGGSILALGEQGGANVQIQTDFFISSADRLNRVAVDGSFLLEAQVGDMSRGTVERDLSVLDASGVLRGQCAAVRATGQISQLVVRPVGPFGARAADMASSSGPCL